MEIVDVFNQEGVSFLQHINMGQTSAFLLDGPIYVEVSIRDILLSAWEYI